MTNPWPMLEYVPVRGAFERAQFRQLRAARKGMLRFFRTRGFFEFVDRMQELRKNPRLNGAQKRLVFEGILNDYAKFVTAKQAPMGTAEAAPVEDAGSAAVVVSDQSEPTQQPDGSRPDADGGIPVLADAINGRVIEGINL